MIGRPLPHLTAPLRTVRFRPNFGHAAVVSRKAKKARCPAPGRSASPPSMLLASIAAAIHGFVAVEGAPDWRSSARAACRVGWLCLTRANRALPVAAAQQAAINPDPINTRTIPLREALPGSCRQSNRRLLMTKEEINAKRKAVLGHSNL